MPFAHAEEAAKLLPRGELRSFRLWGATFFGRVVRRAPCIARAWIFCEPPTELVEEQRAMVRRAGRSVLMATGLADRRGRNARREYEELRLMLQRLMARGVGPARGGRIVGIPVALARRCRRAGPPYRRL